MVSLARLSGAPLLPIFCVQEGDSAGILIIEGPVHIEKDAGREQGLEKSLREYAGLLEGYIRRYPELYRNWHLLDEFMDGCFPASEPEVRRVASRCSKKEREVKRDKVFSGTAARASDFEFNDAVAEVFDDMLVRSVPFYPEQQYMIAEIREEILDSRHEHL